MSYSTLKLIGPVPILLGVPYSSDLTDEQWEVLEPLLLRPGKPGPKHGSDLRKVVNAMLYISRTGCQWRFLPTEFGP